MPSLAEFFVPESLGGAIGYGYGYSRSENTEMERTNLNIQLNGNGYFWEPWFLTLGAGIGIGLSESVSNPGGGGRSTGISGAMDFTLFPVSRFPTQIGFSVTNSASEMTGSALGPSQESESRRFYLRQQYTSRNNLRLMAHYNFIQSIAGDGNESINNSFGLDINKRQSYQTFHGGLSYTQVMMENPDRTNTDSNLYFNHSYLPGPEMGIISLLGYASNSFESGAVTDGETTSTQGSSSFYWRPQDRPFYVSGGLRVIRIGAANGQETRSAGSSLNASYNYSRSTRFLLGINANATDTGGTQTTSLSESFTANYNADPIRLFRMDYSWSAGLGLGNSNQTTDDTTGGTTNQTTDDVQSGSVSFGHRINKAWILTKYNSMNFSVGQGGGATRTSTDDEPTYNINQGASLSWARAAPGAQTNMAMQYSNNRSLGVLDTMFASWTLQLSRQQTINRLSSMSGSFNYQKTSTTTETLDETDPLNPVLVSNHLESSAGSAALNYNHSRFLGIYRLNFASTLTTRDLLRSSNRETTSTGDEVKLDWRNVFTYNIGLLSTSLTVNVTDTGGEQKTWSAFFRATRSF